MKPPSAVVAIFGATQEQVSQKFTQVIENNFNTVSAEHTLNQLSDRELVNLAALYQARAGTGNSKLLSVFASRLSDQALLRVASVFGKNAVTEAVIQNSTSAVRLSFLAKESAVMPLVLQPLMRMPPPPPPSAGCTATLNEIYLDYRTSPVLNMTVGESLTATALYTLGAVYGAWKFGTAIGNGVSNLITNYDPSLSDTIGGTVANMIN